MARLFLYLIPWVLTSVWYYVDREHFDPGQFVIIIGAFWPLALPVKVVSWIIRKIKD